MSSRRIFEFGPFRLDPVNRVLRRGSGFVPLTPKAFQTLLILIENRDRILDKAELLRLVWPDTYTEQSNLPHQILSIRKALGECRAGKQYIETVARRGYRFSAPVRIIEQEPSYWPSAGAAFQLREKSRSSAETSPPSMIGMRILWRGGPFERVALILLLVGAGLVLTTIAARHRSATDVGTIPGRIAEARNQYRLGRLSWARRTSSDYRSAIGHFEQAIRLDPNYAEAYAGLADSYILLGSFGIESPNDVVPRARAAAVRAIELNERSAEAHASIAYLMSRFDWNWAQADREFRRALELDPGYTTARQWYALHLITLGRAQDAIFQIRTAQSLDPDSLVLKTDTALVLFYARRYRDAAEQCRQALHANPSFGLAHRMLGAIYAAQGNYSQAISEFETATTLLGRDPWVIAEIGRSYANLGERQKAMAQLRELQQMTKTRFVDPSAFALLSASMSDRREESFEWLQEQVERHSNVAILAVHPGFDPLRHDPRFQDLLRKTGLPEVRAADPQ